MQKNPLFSIIVVDYEHSATRDEFRRKMISLAAQTSKDFEVLVYHDGPKSIPYEHDTRNVKIHPLTQFHVTKKRENDWGHSNRDRGIKAAKGDWIIHTNADNVFYPNLIETLRKKIKSPKADDITIKTKRLPFLIKSIARRSDKYFGTHFIKQIIYKNPSMDILVFAVRMMGVIPDSRKITRIKNKSTKQSIILGGIPIQHGNIDCMQLVMRRDLWLAEGGWYDRRIDSDGYMYSRFAKKYHVHVVSEILGEHF